ncbi:conserved hypothetical protein [Bradyrhizobium sp. ORS 375]|uniref:hypothetical protein n=1 Tax=Bradyrhizobium sp. (strain ORS 375) TaxID=566679 RepID=UPI00024085FE|nr:hypothetical protein [Bradyrhizobium sp. ORS 375]CCD95804.1 conserved hypothetical protein [Bradyrhizobium sp. ORS 375]
MRPEVLSGLTIVTPSYEKHYQQFARFVASIDSFCLDKSFLTLLVVIETVNRELFSSLCTRHPSVRIRLVTTEAILDSFEIPDSSPAFLNRVGKFTFQTMKKLGGLLRVQDEWALVMDSETLFHKPFSAATLLADYVGQRYVFFTETDPRGARWRDSLGHAVTRNCAEAISASGGDRWYMEYFHWFYEIDKVRELVDHRLSAACWRAIRQGTPGDLFENILFYLFLEKHHSAEYQFIDFHALVQETLPPEISGRMVLSELPFALFGNEYLLNILRPEEVQFLGALFAKYRLPFVRLEPPFLDHRYIIELKKLPSFVATVSSHHFMWLKGRVAICVSGQFRHSVHRTPEHHLRHLAGFLAGVDCDIYVHGWCNTSEAAIIHELQPKAWLFEPRPCFAAIAGRITVHEEKLKPGRDEGSLAMFYGMQRCFELIENTADYDHIVRIRPDICCNSSLKELMFEISDHGDFLPDAVYVPRGFQSKGLNDQFALGGHEVMRTYFRTFDFILENIDKLAFNPEMVLLRNLLENGAQIALLDMPYALMRDEPFRIDSVHHHLHDQEGIWWSRTDQLPVLVDVTAFFSDKLAAAEGILRKVIPNSLVFEHSSSAPYVGQAWIEDYNPDARVIDFKQIAGLHWPVFRAPGWSVKQARTFNFLSKTPSGFHLARWHYDGRRFRREAISGLLPSARAPSRGLARAAYIITEVAKSVRADMVRVLRRLKRVGSRYARLVSRPVP